MDFIIKCPVCQKKIEEGDTTGWVFYMEYEKMIGKMYAHKECLEWKDYEYFMDEYGPLVHHIKMNGHLIMDTGGHDHVARFYQKKFHNFLMHDICTRYEREDFSDKMDGTMKHLIKKYTDKELIEELQKRSLANAETR